MTSYAVFLRGVNVGGINLKMAELRTALETLDLSDVKTLLASGNFVTVSDAAPSALKSSIEGCLRRTFGYKAWVVVLTAHQLTDIIRACPYPANDPQTHSYLTLSCDPFALDALEEAGRDDTELSRLSPEALAWLAPAGGTTDSPFGKLCAKAKYKSTTTTRNLRTLVKVRDVLAKEPQNPKQK